MVALRRAQGPVALSLVLFGFNYRPKFGSEWTWRKHIDMEMESTFSPRSLHTFFARILLLRRRTRWLFGVCRVSVRSRCRRTRLGRNLRFDKVQNEESETLSFGWRTSLTSRLTRWCCEVLETVGEEVLAERDNCLSYSSSCRRSAHLVVREASWVRRNHCWLFAYLRPCKGPVYQWKRDLYDFFQVVLPFLTCRDHDMS
jgi:hypothetical protein